VPTYVVEFAFPEVTCYAGRCDDGACGIAMHLATADRFTDPEDALRLMKNGYGEEFNKWGRVVEIGKVG
jgi:hypothetical protein